jgi:HEAT repeats
MNATEDIAQLFAKTLVGDYDDEAPWDAVAKLRRIGSRDVFETAVEWCRSEEPLVRARGLDVLAQLGKAWEHPENSFPEQAYSIVSELVQQEEVVRPLSSAIFALGTWTIRAR